MRQLKPLVFIPYVNVTPSRIVAFTYVEGLERRRSLVPKLSSGSALPVRYEPIELIENPISFEDHHFNHEATIINEKNATLQIGYDNLKNKDTNGVISFAAKKNIRSAINWFYAMTDEKKFGYKDRCRFRLNFFTITLSAKQMHTDDYIKKEMLNRLLEDMRRIYGVKSYIWRAEIQEKKKDWLNIHFHITCNVYIDKYEFRDLWNSIQAKHGYIDAFEKKHRHRNPNSTDVHSVQEITNLAGYLAKYMAKDGGSRAITGRQWFLSRSLSSIKPIQRIFEGQLRHEIETFIAERKMKFKDYDYAYVCYADIFTADLSEYSSLQEMKDEAFALYHDQVN